MDLKDFATDFRKEAEGVWVQFGEDVELRIGRMNNEHYYDVLNQLRDPYIKVLPRGGKLDDVTGDRIYNESLAKCVLLGWRGNFCINGKHLDYTYDTALRLLSHKSMRGFRARVVELGLELQNFALDNLEELEGNLLSSSGSTVQ